MLIKLALQQEFELADYQQSEQCSLPRTVLRLLQSALIWPDPLLPFNGFHFRGAAPDLHNSLITKRDALIQCFIPVYRHC